MWCFHLANPDHQHLSEYVYLTASQKSLKIDNPQFAKEVSDMLGMSNNLNQIAKVYNAYHTLPDGLESELKECLLLIKETLSKL